MPHPIPSRRRTRKTGPTWRHFYQTDGGGFAHPSAPDSSGAPGAPHASDAFLFTGIPHPDSPAADHQTDDRLFHFDTVERAECVCEAIWIAPDYVGDMVIVETGRDLKGLYEGMVPMMAMSLGVVAATTAIGGAGGALIGAMVGGPFALATAAEGAAEGGAAGLAAGLSILEWLGIGFLVVYIGDNLGQATGLASAAVVIAWKAPDSPLENAEIDRAAHKLADAVAKLIKLVLMGIVMFLLEKGTAAAASRVSELAGKLRASRFGRALGDWVEANWKSLIEDPRLHEKQPTPTSGGASEGAPAQTSSSTKDRTAAPDRKAATREQKDDAPRDRDWRNTDRKAAIKASGMVKEHAEAISQVAQDRNEVILMQNVNGAATAKLAAGEAVPKPMSIKAKTARSGPAEGYVPVDQKLSKAAEKGPKEVAKYQKEVEKALSDTPPPPAAKIVTIQTKDGPVEVLADPLTNKPFTSDYDLLMIGGEGPRGPVMKEGNLGRITTKEMGTVSDINNAVGYEVNGEPTEVVMHGPANNARGAVKPEYPVTAFGPDGSIESIENDAQLKGYVNKMNAQGYKLEMDPAWGL